MITVVPIVEGDGEVSALPILLRRIAAWQTPSQACIIRPPIRVPRNRFIRIEEHRRKSLLLAANLCGASGWILILLDADDDCPAALGADIYHAAKSVISHRNISVVLANREYEAWFLAAAGSLHGKRGLVVSGDAGPNCESIRDAKGWLSTRMENGYREMIHQSAFSDLFDLEIAYERSRSFRKLCSEWQRQMYAFQPDDAGSR